jgi:hypothetical protein
MEMIKYAFDEVRSRTAHIVTGRTKVHVYTRCGALLLKSATRTTFDLRGLQVCSSCASVGVTKFVRVKSRGPARTKYRFSWRKKADPKGEEV